MYKCIILLLILLLPVSAKSVQKRGFVTAADSLTVLTLRNSASPGKNKLRWNWSSVETNKEGRVIALKLSFRETGRMHLDLLKLDQLESLTISGLTTKKLPQIVTDLPHLKKLTMIYCKLDTIPQEIYGIQTLEELDLSGNRMVYVGTGEMPSQVKKLSLKSNDIRALEGIKKQFPNLQSLNISGNRNLGVIPPEVFQLDSLKELIGTSLELGEFQMEEPVTAPLESLNLAFNNIETLPSGLSGLSHLRHLNLSNNRLTSIDPEALKSLVHLQLLYLQNNSLQKIPASIGDLKELRVLDISRNKLIEFPNYATNCVKLDTLKLGYNSIEKLPKSIYQLNNLTYLDLSNNKLRTLPDQFSQFGTLKVLWLSRNQLESMPKSLESFFEKNPPFRYFMGNPFKSRELHPAFHRIVMKSARVELDKRKTIITHLVHEGGYPLGYSGALTLGFGFTRRTSLKYERQRLQRYAFLSGKGAHLLIEPGINGGRIGAGINFMPFDGFTGPSFGHPQFTLRAIGTKFWEKRNWKGNGGDRYVGVELGYSRLLSIHGGVSWEYGEGERMLYSISMGWGSLTTSAILPNL